MKIPKNTNTKKHENIVDSYSSDSVKHTRKVYVLVNIFIAINLLIVPAIFFSLNFSEKTGNQITAQTSYRPPYDPTAIFNTPIPDNYPSDSRSVGVISKWTSVMGNNSGIFFAINGEVPGLYKSNNSSPTYTFSGGASGTFKVPSNAAAGGGSDYPLEVINTDTMQELRVWRATINHATKTITGQGASLHYYNNDGAIKNPNGTKSTARPYQGGGAGNGLSYYAGMITKDDWDSGYIKHALRIAYNNCSFVGGSYRIPSTKSDQPNGCNQSPNTDAVGGMEMGMILQLDKSVDCNSRTSPTGKANDNKFVRMVCKAMQDYGVMISDGTGVSSIFYMEHENTAKWGDFLTKSSTGHLGNHFRSPGTTNGVPWNKFRVVQKPSSFTAWGAGTPSVPTQNTTGGSTGSTTGSNPSTGTGTTSPGTTPTGTTSTAAGTVSIPENTDIKDDGSIVADFNGDKVKDVARDLNNDKLIDVATELVVDGAINPELVKEVEKSTAGLIGVEDKTKSNLTEPTVKIGSLPETSVNKIVAYSLGTAGVISFVSISTYLAITKLTIFSGIRIRLGL